MHCISSCHRPSSSFPVSACEVRKSEQQLPCQTCSGRNVALSHGDEGHGARGSHDVTDPFHAAHIPERVPPSHIARS